MRIRPEIIVQPARQPRPCHPLAAILVALLSVPLLTAVGCTATGESASAGPAEDSLRMKPIAQQQREAYEECVGERFVSLADFEPRNGKPGHRQLDDFEITPATEEARLAFVVNITRTGVGGLEATLPPGRQLLMHLTRMQDFRRYTLLSMAVYSDTLRDDFRVELSSVKGTWASHRTLVRPGWNTVLVDIRRLAKRDDFDAELVTAVRMGFVNAAGPVAFNLDDVLLLDNRREITPSPPGWTLRKNGLNYTLESKAGTTIRLTQSDDGLWRLDRDESRLQLLAGNSQPSGGEQLAVMGARKVGRVELLEHNAVRIRLANTWYFPTRAGQWLSLAIRRIRWEHTFYADGRWVTHLTVNNSGGKPIRQLKLAAGRPAAWHGQQQIAESLAEPNFGGPVERYSYLRTLVPDPKDRLKRSYLKTGIVRLKLAATSAFAKGDHGRDGFDESQGCYYLQATRGHCRFRLIPPAGGLAAPLIRVGNLGSGPVSANSEGLPIRQMARTSSGDVLLVVPGRLTGPTDIEVTGPPRSTIPQ